MSTAAVRAVGLSKRFRIGGRARYKSLRESIQNAVTTPLRRRRAQETIWALRDVTFEVERGEVVGIIGRNGAGKSTLLKILSRITEPTEGRVELRGRVGSLLEVGTGFHPELTGRENIYLNGAVLGMRRAEIQEKFSEIVAFAEVEKFIETPVKHYSTGMYLRLAFAVAAHLEPEILLVDEVLAVGDAAFQRKCLGKMGDVARGGRTVLFVSHNMAAVQSLCQRALCLNGGRIEDAGEVGSVVRRYLQALGTSERVDLEQRNDRQGDGSVRLVAVRVESLDSDGVIRPTSRLRVALDYRSEKPLVNAKFLVGVYSLYGNGVFLLDSEASGRLSGTLPPCGTVVCETDRINLTPGRCMLNLAVVKGVGMADYVQSASHFDVEQDDIFGSGKLPDRDWMMCVIGHTWSMGSMSAGGDVR